MLGAHSFIATALWTARIVFIICPRETALGARTFPYGCRVLMVVIAFLTTSIYYAALLVKAITAACNRELTFALPTCSRESYGISDAGFMPTFTHISATMITVHTLRHGYTLLSGLPLSLFSPSCFQSCLTSRADPSLYSAYMKRYTRPSARQI